MTRRQPGSFKITSEAAGATFITRSELSPRWLAWLRWLADLEDPGDGGQAGQGSQAGDAGKRAATDGRNRAGGGAAARAESTFMGEIMAWIRERR